MKLEQNKKYFTKGGSYYDNESFINKELTLLIELLFSTGKQSKLKDSVLKKIYFKSKFAVHGKHIFNAHLRKILQKIEPLNSTCTKNQN